MDIAVNIANRMETLGAPGRPNVSALTYSLIRDAVECEYRGKSQIQGRWSMDRYCVKGLLE